MKYYLYHIFPKDMKGNILSPLKGLKEINSDLYSTKKTKYSGRKRIRKLKIKKLNCRWDDVLFFSAVHPSKINQALLDAGLPKNRYHALIKKSYQVDVDCLDPSKAVVFWYRSWNKILSRYVYQYISDKQIDWFNPKDMDKYSVIPDKTKKAFRKRIKNNEMLLLFEYVPHILYNGSIDVSNKDKVSIVELD
ncbi:MAG: hypothetical protein QF864_10245 [SAR202 cluster bacterium]|jgi:hypothetical protein|nr:hypothetical protein [SAR202 cluster bacterium]